MIGFGKHRAAELPDRLASLGAAVELAEGRLDPDHIAFARNVLEKARQRLRHGTEFTVAAVLGPTGAGKSSLVNAIVGSDVATTGVRRPTTSNTSACVFGDEHDSGPLLDWLEVANRHLVGADEFDGLILLDVPDHDSVEVSHRLEMERIAEHVDLLIWVTDPEKYGDNSLHRYLHYLAGHEAVTLVVLNKTDQLSADELVACRTDLSRLLVEDGVPGATVLAVSSETGAGVAELRSILRRAVADRASAVSRIRADVAVAASELEADVGDGRPGTVDGGAREQLASDLVDATGIEAVSEAVVRSTGRDAAAALGWPFTRWVRKLRPDPLRRLHLDRGSSGRTSMPGASPTQILRAERAIRAFADDLTSELDEPWPTAVRAAATPDEAVLRDRLDTAVADAVRDHRPRRPRWWTLLSWLQWAAASATIVGALWLGALFVLDWSRLPDPPTPEWRQFPLPTLLLIVGVAGGLLISFFGRRVATISARRAGGRVRRAAQDNIAEAAEELVIAPATAELTLRSDVLAHLKACGADPRLVATDARAAG